MDVFVDACSLGSFTTRMPNRFCVDRLITAMILSAREEPDARLPSQALPVLSQFVQQPGAEHDIAISATFAAPDVKDHALTVDVCNFQVRQFGTSQPSGVERHQQDATEGSVRCIDQSRNFFLAQNRW